MPNGKRESMREGPLADLFRKTAEDTGDTPVPAEAPQREPGEDTAAAPTPPTSSGSEPSEREPRAQPPGAPSSVTPENSDSVTPRDRSGPAGGAC